jgi:two-component system, OmpR family, phosphate regulon sensor histidine kinase PhoR
MPEVQRRSAAEPAGTAAWRDLAWIAFGSAPVFIILARLDVFERYRGWVQRHGLSAWEADDAIFLLVFLAVAFGIFSFRRWRELEAEVRMRRRAERLKDEFLATVSHELRTPLTTIQEGVSQVQDGLLGETTALQREILGLVLEDSERLTRLIDDLLDGSRIKSGRMQVHRRHVDMGAVVRQTVERYAPEARRRGLGLSTVLAGASLEIYADPDRLLQIWSNLLDNALRFTPTGAIRLRVEDGGDHLSCQVEDTGIGIPEAELPKIFTRFHQVGRTPGPGRRGTGLGLSIVKGLVESHGGEVEVRSRPGKGSTFIFRLPKAQA